MKLFILIAAVIFNQSNGWPGKPYISKPKTSLCGIRSILSDNVKTFNKLTISIMLIGNLVVSPIVAQADETLVEQLKVVQALQLQGQKQSLELQEQEELQKGILYEQGKLIAKGVVTLAPAVAGISPDDFPLGLPNAVSLDPAFDNDKESIFLTATGREGPPVAAKRYFLKDITFPLVFDITTDDLLFPYTEDAWRNSPISYDSIAVTCILDADGTLVTPSKSDRFGFAISDPAKLGGIFQRTEAKLIVNMKSDGREYTPEEIELLGRVDREVSRLEGLKQQSAKATDSKSKTYRK